MTSPASNRPAKGTPEWDLWVAAIEVAAHAPERHGPTTPHAKIPWTAIEELRAALDAVGIDWLTVVRKRKALHLDPSHGSEKDSNPTTP